MKKVIIAMVLPAWIGLLGAMTPPAGAAETDVFTNILTKMDGLVCSQPEKITAFYSSKGVILIDDKRALLENRIEDYQRMKADLQDMKCQTARQVLAGAVGTKVGYVLVDEIISVSSRLSTDERQHSVCNYVFAREGSSWKIVLEQCSSLPDYSIRPGDDALYYFHNPVY